MRSTSSRIPTLRTKSNSTSTSSTTNENLPPSSSISKSKPSLLKPNKLATTLDKPRVFSPPDAVEISVQLPTSDGAGVSDIEEQREGKFRDEEQEGESESEKEQDTLKVPSSTRARERREAEKKTLKKGVAKSTKSTSLLPVPTTRSRSKSPSILPPSKPTYATLTSRRRSAARERRSSVSLSPAPPTMTLKPAKRSPRPSEILPPLKLVDASEEEEEDELLLLPPERGRGKGEGKEGAWRKWERERKARSLSAGVKEEANERREESVEQEQEQAREQEDEDLGGYDAGDQMFDVSEEEGREGDAREGTGQNEPVEVNFGSEDEGQDGAQDQDVVDAESKVELQAMEEEQGSEEEEEDQKDFLPSHDSVSKDDIEPEQQDEDLPFPDQPRYSPSRSPSSNPRDETPPPLQEGQSYLQIFPPLSPNTTGEFDDVEPLRFSETPAPPDIRLEDQTREEEEGAEQERQLEPPSPFLSRLELSQQQEELPSPSQSNATPETTDSVPHQIKSEELAPPSVPPAASLLSPSTFIQRTLARARSLTPTVPVASPQRAQFNFVALPSPRSRARHQFSHSPRTTQARQPSPLAPLPAEAAWTRGPAFFRSSSFTPPPVRSSFDRKGKGKAVNQDEDLERSQQQEGEGEVEDEQSREYWNPGEMTATSPHFSEKGQPQEVFEEEEEEEEEDEISLIRQPSRSVSIEENAPPTPVKDHLPPSSPAHQEQVDDSDASMHSPVSLRSRHSSASPPRSPNGDMIMSSPVASFHSRSRSQSASSTSSTYSTNKKLPATPPPIAEVVDQEMVSPSPARTQFLRISPSKLEELVEAGKGKLTGLLSFASSPRASTSQSIQAQAETSTPVPSTSKAQLPAPRTAQKAGDAEQDGDEDDDDRPFPVSLTRPQHADESTFTSSHLSFADSTTSRSRRQSRPRPSHSSFPVIEISSTDAKAAARAAAILKVYHKYVEQGIEGGLARDEASRIVRDAERKGLEAEAEEADVEEESEEEEELRTLLLDAEEEVRETFGAAREGSIGFVEQAQDDEEEEEEVRSVLLSSGSSNRSQSPSTSQHAQPSSVASQSHARSRSVSNDSASGLSSVVGEKWTSQEWRRLEQSLVELKRRIRSKSEHREPESEEVVEAFLKKWGVSKEECQGDWEWDKLFIRVEAIKARRAKDVRNHRASSQASALSIATSVCSKTTSNAAEEGDTEYSASPTPTVIKEEEEEEGEEQEDSVKVRQEARQSDSGSEDEEEEGRTRDVEDDTFFSTNRRLRRTRRTSMPHTRLPTALSNPRLAHIYDDAPIPEKPRLPMMERERSREPSVTEPEEATPEPALLPEPISSASRLFSYLGSFVRRSPGPSPTSSKFAPSSSQSPPPESSVEMSETRLRPSEITPRAAPLSTDESLPHLANRKIRPLPHTPLHEDDHASSSSTSTPVASTSEVTLDVPKTLRRRRSSGEGRVWVAVTAIEEAESSREEEEARIVELLRSGSAKRKASAGDLRRKVTGAGGKGKGKERAVESDLGTRSVVRKGGAERVERE